MPDFWEGQVENRAKLGEIPVSLAFKQGIILVCR